MAMASASTEIPVSADAVWDLIGGFGSLPDWNAAIASSILSEGGRVRRLTTVDGAEIVERLVRFDEAERSYTYRIVRSPFPQKDYLSTLRVAEAGDGDWARVIWSGRFTADGVGDDIVEGLFQGIYDGGLQSLDAHFACAAR